MFPTVIDIILASWSYSLSFSISSFTVIFLPPCITFSVDYGLKQIVPRNTARSFRIINRSLNEEVYVFRRYDFVIKPIRLLYYRLIYVEQSIIADTYERII